MSHDGLARMPLSRRTDAIAHRVRVNTTLRDVSLLLLLTCCFFWEVILGGQAFIPNDLMYDFPVFEESAPADSGGSSNPLLSDPVLKFYPWHVAVREALQAGEFPFWNPYIYTGTPLFANGESAVLYPINVVGYLIPLPEALALSAILRMLVAGTGMYLFVRQLHVGGFGSLIAAVTFMFSGSMIVWINYPVGGAYAWLPLMFFLAERILATRRLIYVPLMAATVATQVLAGHYQTSFIMVLALAIYCAARLVANLRAREPARASVVSGALLTGGVLLGFSLTAVQLVPFWEWLQRGTEVNRRLEQQAFAVVDPSFWKNLVSLATIAVPNLFGNPTWGSAFSFFHSNYIEQMTYVGIVSLTLAIMAVLAVVKPAAASNSGRAPVGAGPMRERTLVWLLAGMGLIFLGLSIRLPGVDLINDLPLFNLVATERYRLIFTFVMAVLAGIGAERVFAFESGAAFIRRTSRILLLLAGLAALSLILVSWSTEMFRDRLISFGRLRDQYQIFVDAYRPLNLGMYLPVLVAAALAVLLILYSRNMIRKHQTQWVLLSLVVVDLFAFGISFNPTIPRGEITPDTPATSFLREHVSGPERWRVVAMNNDFPPNTGIPYGLIDVAGVDFPPQRYADLAAQAGGNMDDPARISFTSLNPALINLMSVKYITASEWPQGLSDGQIQAVFTDENVTIYENLQALPRAFIVPQATVLGSSDAILQRLSSSTFDPYKEVILEEPLPEALVMPGEDSSGTAHIVDAGSDWMTIEAETAGGGFLFLNDAHYPGWQARLDGQPNKIYRANFAFRAVYIPDGFHQVEFRYEPEGFQTGLAISLVSLAVTVLVGLVAVKRRREIPAETSH